MESYHHVPMKMKRKDFEQVYDHFSDFSISSPARKIRRLDAELPSISEEEEMEVPIIEHYEGEYDFGNDMRMIGVGGCEGGSGRGIVIEELPDEPLNEERAIVVFNPVSPLVASPSNFSVTVSPQLISGFKNQMMCTFQQTNPLRQTDSGATEPGETSETSNNCMAVVPWMPSQVPSAAGDQLSYQNDVNDMMDAEESETTTMEIEDSNGTGESGIALTEGLQHQWQQQHCLIPQPPQNKPTPVVWLR